MFTEEQTEKIKKIFEDMNKAQARKKKVLKKLKKMAIYSLCSLTAFTTLTLSTIIATNNNIEECEKKIENVLSDSNYEMYNLKHKSQQQEKILADYNAGKITDKELIKLTEQIVDYDKLTYVLNASEISTEIKKEFVVNWENIEKQSDISKVGIYTGSIGMSVTTLGALFATIGIIAKDNRENETKRRKKKEKNYEVIERGYDGFEEKIYPADDKVIMFDKDFLKNKD